jgi:hypothetical protein
MTRASIARRVAKLERSRRQQQAAPLVLHIVAYDADTGKAYPPVPVLPRTSALTILSAGTFDYQAAIWPILAPEEPPND